MAPSRAVMNKNAKGNERHASKAITDSSAVGTGRVMPKRDRSSLRELKKAIGSFQPSSLVPQSLTRPYCGLSIVDHTKVAATTGAT